MLKGTQAMTTELRPTDDQIESACLSYRHDFGLLEAAQQSQIKYAGLEWLLAWQKAMPQMGNTQATITQLEKACAEWAEVSQSNHQRAKRAEARVAELEAERDAALDMMAAQPMALSKALRELGYLVPIFVVSTALRAALSREELKP
jgi:hypothetical protein